VPVIHISPELWAEVMRSLKAGRKVRALPKARWQANIDALIEEHIPAADKIAVNVWRRFTRAGQGGYSSRIDVEDMKACAYIGLVEAARRYDPTDGAFLRFAYLRIRGAILERYRRNAYRDMQHQSFEEWIEQESEGQPNEKHLMPSRLAEALRDPGPLPDEIAARRERGRLAEAAIDALPDDERWLLRGVLGGTPVGELVAQRGLSLAWGRQKLAAARDRVAGKATGIAVVPTVRRRDRDWRDEVKDRAA
jgi:RNA polymerase sigma factor (sigma-70 family)